MQAVEFDSYGAANVLRYRDVEPPEAHPGQVLVAVTASSVNPKDTFVRKGRFRKLTGNNFPLRSGFDASGLVVHSAHGFAAGESVFGMLNGWRGGAAADLVAWPAEELAAAPRSIPLAEAAAVPLAGLTALQALRDHLKVRNGQSVLINGASGGVGLYAVQIAKTFGAHVIGICGSAASDIVLGLGADGIHDYAQGWVPAGSFDCVFDVFGNLPIDAVKAATGLGGRFVTTVPSATNLRAALAIWRRPRMRIVNVRSRSSDLTILAEMIDAGNLRIRIDGRYPASEAAAAHRRVESKHTRGKVILDFADSRPA